MVIIFEEYSSWAKWKKKQFTILPNLNMVSNIGFGADATHTFGESEFANLKAYELELKTHPKDVKRDLEADDFTSRLMFERKSLFERVVSKIKRALK